MATSQDKPARLLFYETIIQTLLPDDIGATDFESLVRSFIAVIDREESPGDMDYLLELLTEYRR